MTRRTQQRIAELFAENEGSIEQENKERQTDVTENFEWNFALNAICNMCMYVSW